MSNLIQLVNPEWHNFLRPIMGTADFMNLENKLEVEYKKNTIFPIKSNLFNAFNATSLNNLKVVVIGQDPYHGGGQAHGLAFSVPNNSKIPPSLRNIFKELENDLDIPPSKSGDLTNWAKQGVLLLNASLTVEANKPGSHSKLGWTTFTNSIIENLSNQFENLVFILWGKFAQQKEELIDGDKHLVLTAAHPSPFSARNGFFGCKHFSKTNRYLKSHNQPPIDWELE